MNRTRIRFINKAVHFSAIFAVAIFATAGFCGDSFDCLSKALVRNLGRHFRVNGSIFPTEQLHVPHVEFFPGWVDDESTRIGVLSATNASIDDQLGVIRFASQHFNRRGWSQEFLLEREKVARDFAPRSAYLTVGTRAEHSVPVNNSSTEGSIGITYATATREELNSKPEAELLTDLNKILPQEAALKKAVTRYYDSHGRSIIVELRTYAKDPKAAETILNNLRSSLVTLTFHTIRDYPELYDFPIIYTYGDKVSVRMYGALGFKVQENLTPIGRPIHHDGSDWWILAATPRDLEKSWLFNLKGSRRISNLNQPYPIRLPSGGEALAAPGTTFHVDGNDFAFYFVTQNKTLVSPGVYASPDSLVTFLWGKIDTIDKISDNPFGIPKNSYVYFKSQPKESTPFPYFVSAPGKPTRVPGFSFEVLNGYQVSEDGTGLNFAEGLTADLKIGQGLIAAKGSDLTGVRPSKVHPGSIECEKLTLAQDYSQEGKLYKAGTTVLLRWNSGKPEIIGAEK